MKMNVKEFFKLGLILAAYSVVACTGLALVYAVTENVIAERQQSDLEASLATLFPEADGFEDLAGKILPLDSSMAFPTAYLAKTGDIAIGVAIKVVGPSYGGKTTMLVGVGIDRRIKGVNILESKDTPGLGANAMNPTYFVGEMKDRTFPGQFIGKPLTDPFEVKRDVAAITASTITSRALTAMVKAAGEAGAKYLESRQGGY